MLKPKILLVGAAALAVGLFGATPSARADNVAVGQISLTAGNSNIAATGGGPYGTIEIKACSSVTSGVCTEATAGSTASIFQITVTPDTGYVLGDSKILALNFSSAVGAVTGAGGTGDFTLVSCTLAGGGSCSLSINYNGTGATPTTIQVDGFGQFDYVLNDGSGFQHPISQFTIDVYTTNGITVPMTGNLDLSLLLSENSPQNAAAAAHVAPTDNTACTGWVAGGIPGETGPSSQTPTTSGPCVSAPDPSTGGMLAIGLLGVGGFGLIWRRRREDLI